MWRYNEWRQEWVPGSFCLHFYVAARCRIEFFSPKVLVMLALEENIISANRYGLTQVCISGRFIRSSAIPAVQISSLPQRRQQFPNNLPWEFFPFSSSQTASSILTSRLYPATGNINLDILLPSFRSHYYILAIHKFHSFSWNRFLFSFFFEIIQILSCVCFQNEFYRHLPYSSFHSLKDSLHLSRDKLYRYTPPPHNNQKLGGFGSTKSISR